LRYFGGAKEHSKSGEQFTKDLAVEGLGLGLGKIYDKGMTGYRNKTLSRFVDNILGGEIFENMLQVPVDVGISKALESDSQVRRGGKAMVGQVVCTGIGEKNVVPEMPPNSDMPMLLR
jgi:hypothetical protein